MISNRKCIFAVVSTASIFGSLLAGCGGSSSSVEGISGNVITSGGLQSASGTGTPGTSSGNTPQQVQVTINGSTVTGTLPAKETIPTSGIVSTIAPGVPILNGLTLAPRLGIKDHGATVSEGVQGEVDVDGCNTGLTVNSQGDVSGYLILVPGVHTITAIGPFNIVGGSTLKPTKLTVGQFIFNVAVGPDGVSSVPSALSVNLPANGGVFKASHFVKVTLEIPDFASATANLTISFPGDSISKTKTFAKGVATYTVLNSKLIVPAGGVSTVEWSILSP